MALESPEWSNGVFTFSLIESLDNRADLNEDLHMEIDELTTYVSARVRNLTGGAQHPTVRQANFGNTFEVFGGSENTRSPPWGP